jgi:hypothetical protein
MIPTTILTCRICATRQTKHVHLVPSLIIERRQRGAINNIAFSFQTECICRLLTGKFCVSTSVLCNLICCTPSTSSRLITMKGYATSASAFVLIVYHMLLLLTKGCFNIWSSTRRAIGRSAVDRQLWMSSICVGDEPKLHGQAYRLAVMSGRPLREKDAEDRPIFFCGFHAVRWYEKELDVR